MTDLSSTTSTEPPASDDDPFYSFKVNLGGAPTMLWLRRDGLEWNIGRRSGLVRYDRIRRVRLSYRPATLQAHRFTTELWAADAPKIQIASTSWQGLTMQQRFDAPYVAFVTELHRRMDAVNSQARFQCGMARAAHLIGLVVVAAAALAFAMLMFKAAQIGEWRTAGIIGVIFAVFGWQIGSYVIRNQPAEYRPAAIPPRVLPRT